MVAEITKLSDSNIRNVGLAVMIAGLLLLFVVRS